MRRVVGCVVCALAVWLASSLARADELRIYNPNPKAIYVYVRATIYRDRGPRSWTRVQVAAEGERTVRLRSDDPFDVCFWFPSDEFGGLYDVPLRAFIASGPQGEPLEWATEIRKSAIWVFDPASGEYVRQQQTVQSLGPAVLLEVGEDFIRVELPRLIGYDPPRPPVIPPRPRRGG